MKTLIYLLFVLTGLCASTKGTSSTLSRNEINPEITSVESTIRTADIKRQNFAKTGLNPESLLFVHNKKVQTDFISKYEDGVVNSANETPLVLNDRIKIRRDEPNAYYNQPASYNLLDAPSITLDPPSGLCQDVELYTDCGPPNSFTISGNNLTSDLYIEWEDVLGFAELSLEEEGNYASSLTLIQNNGIIETTQIFVRNCMQSTCETLALIKISGTGILEYYPVWNNMLPGNAPIATIPDVSAEPGSTITVPVTVVDCNFFSFATYCIEYNPSVLTFQHVLPEWIMAVNDVEINPFLRRLSISLGNSSDDCWSVPDGETLFSMVFMYNGGSTALTFADCSANPFQRCCYLIPNDEPFEDYHINGSVSQTPPPEITLDPPSGLGQDVEIYTDCGPPNSFTVSGINLTSNLVIAWENAYGYAELCLTENGEYVTSLTLEPVNGSIETTVFVRLCMLYNSEAQAYISFLSDGIYELYPVWNNMLPGNAPVATIENVAAEPGSTVVVPVTVEDFDNISFANYYIEYNPIVLTFQDVVTDYVLTTLNDYDIGPDIRRLSIGFGSTSDYCWSVPDNETLFNLVFSYNCGNSELTFSDPHNHDFEKCYYLIPNDEPFEDFHHNGSVNQSPPPEITLDPPTGLGQDVEIYTDCGSPNSFTIAGSNLTSNLTIELGGSFGYAEFSLEEEGVYTSSLTLMPDNGIIETTPIFVRICISGVCESQAFIKISGCGILEYYPVWDNMLPGNAPVSSIADIIAEPGNTIVVPVTIEDYNAISFANFYIEYDPNVLTFQHALPEWIMSVNDAYVSPDKRRISIGFGSTSDYCESIRDHATLFSLVFFYIGGNADLTFVKLSNNHFQKCCYFLPNEQPFEDYHHNGSICERKKKADLKIFLESLYDPSTERMIKTRGADGDMFGGDTTDIVTVKLAQSAHPYPIIATFENVELNQNGSISILPPDSLIGNYYIIVSHRNSIDTWSAIPVEFNGYQIIYDFTEDHIRAYGNNLRPNGDKYCIFMGDADHNGVVDTGDMTLIENDASNYASGYLTTDINGDGIVDTYDMTIVDNNASNYVGVICPNVQDLPSVITSGISNIAQTTATGGGHIFCSGGTCVIAHGVCWTTLPNPTKSDNHTTDGIGTCIFTSNIFGLTPGTRYYLRAYATNYAGTAYGENIEFTTTLATAGNGTTDIDSIFYTSIILGQQEWMAENLKTTRYANGDPIPNVTGNTEWSALETGAWCWYNNDNQYENPYGKLYNWHAVADSRNLCPEGWHIPTDAEWTVLTDFLGGENVADGKMKEAGILHWNAPNTDADNSSGFTGLPGGSRSQSGTFSYLRSYGYWWSSSEKDSGSSWSRSLGFNYIAVVRPNLFKKNGISVRCLREVSLPDPYTASVSGITETSAKGGGNILSDGGAPVDLGGICWSTSPNPTTADNHTTDGSETGAFLSNLTNLLQNTLYYVRAYATNSVGTIYGNEVSFRTLPGFECGSPLTVNHIISGGIAPVDKTTTYGTVTGLMGEPSKCWITSNLGADHQAVAVDDPTEASAGWYWQFNRKQGYRHDGVNLIPGTWNSSINENSDWLTLNDPCNHELGAGWRIPTYTEWFNVKGANNNWNNWSDWTHAWNSGLKLHAAGIVSSYDGSIYNRGVWGSYWSSMQSGTANGWTIYFNGSNCLVSTDLKSNGYPVRCLRDNTGTGAKLPVLTTGSISGITVNSAICSGNVTNDGGAAVTAFGVCWSTSPGPTINNFHTTDGSGTGSFTSTLSGLTSGTAYYVRAYAINRAGTEYGNEVSFTTE
jgi:uncharacterized protein (TIGR02145 family)